MTEPEWIDVAAEADVPVDDVAGVQLHGLELALYNVRGVLFATANACTHGQARLCDGFLEGHEIECPLHQGRFDVRDGRALCAPLTQPIQTYPVKVDGGRVYVRTS